ncbi:MAG: T9SS type A sorting domain-containing protein [Tannerella sp.]|nr:T9SS type A sorting domain-containing protein [Tannerella sp.]
MYGFNSDGTINNNFGENGFFYYSDFWSNSKETILINGENFLIGKDKKIIRVHNNGTIDNDFNHNGVFVFEDFTINDIKKQTSNQFIIGGSEGLVRLNISDATSIIANEISNSVKIFPNPAKEELRIESEELQINGIEIVDLSSKTIYKSNTSTNRINVSMILQGIYFLKLETDKGIVTKKFVKE